LKKLAYFSTWKSDGQRTTFTTHSTTFSPPKHHTKGAPFLKHPSKNTSKNNKTPERTMLASGFIFF
jgi:hypothetical protein